MNRQPFDPGAHCIRTAGCALAVVGHKCPMDEPCKLKALEARVDGILGNASSPDGDFVSRETSEAAINPPLLTDAAIVARWIDRHGYPPQHISIWDLTALAAEAVDAGCRMELNEEPKP
jgi:hypothetical protein